MRSVGYEQENDKFDTLISEIAPGNVYFVTGKNGAGKSRFLGYAAQRMLQTQTMSKRYQAQRLICMSGTMHDRYPSVFYKLNIFDETAVYLGGKVNNNMVSDIAPFRKLCYFMLKQISRNYSILSAEPFLKRLGYECKIRLKFQDRQEYSRSGRYGSGLGDSDIELTLIGSENEDIRVYEYLQQLRRGLLRLADMQFFRQGHAVRINELSSGEKHYILALLGFIFCGEGRCILLYDEPENSLHPEWQLSIVRDLNRIAENIHAESTIVIATHSPLIASSVQNTRAYVCNLPEGQAWHRSDL